MGDNYYNLPSKFKGVDAFSNIQLYIVFEFNMRLSSDIQNILESVLFPYRCLTYDFFSLQDNHCNREVILFTVRLYEHAK